MIYTFKIYSGLMYLVLSLIEVTHIFTSPVLFCSLQLLPELVDYSMRVNYSKTTYHDGHPSHLHTSKDPQSQRMAASQKQVIDKEDLGK
jgi:hypothetical protein